MRNYLVNLIKTKHRHKWILKKREDFSDTILNYYVCMCDEERKTYQINGLEEIVEEGEKFEKVYTKPRMSRAIGIGYQLKERDND